MSAVGLNSEFSGSQTGYFTKTKASVLYFLPIAEGRNGIYNKIKMATIVEGDQKAPFSIATTSRCGGADGATPFPVLLHYALDTYLILLGVKQGGIKYHF